jgi:acetolactate decarboxylase
MRFFTLTLLFIAQVTFAQSIVKYSGSMSKMGKENFKATIILDTLPKSNLYGLGPYGKMQGEITVIDGKPLIAEAQADGSAKVSQSWKAEAPFFVYQQVSDWVAYDLSFEIESLADLQQAIETIARQKGYNLTTAFAFKVVGNIDNLTTHIVLPRSSEIQGYQAGKNQLNYEYNNSNGELIGFYSQQHQGVYTHKDSYIHVHFISKDMTQMGHVDKISLSGKSLTLLLPAKVKSTGSIKIKTNDTDFSKGRLGHTQEITIDDVAKFHGHLCDGLVVGFLGLREALYKLYPDSIIDRTNTRIVSNASPCLTDVGVYLTGGRYQFNTFYVDDKLKTLYTVSRIDNNKTYQVKLRPGVKPTAIDSLGSLAVQRKLSPCALEGLRNLEDKFVKTDIVNKNGDKCLKFDN